MTGHRVSGGIVPLLAALWVSFSAPAAAARWEPLPLWGGGVVLAAAEGDSSVVYAASPTAGLYRSVDQGGTWQKVAAAGLGRYPIRIYGVDPHDPRRLYAVAREEPNSRDGLFRSEDGGAHWQRSDAGIPEEIRDLAFDPETPGQIYAATSRGLFGSQDGGRTWVPTGLAEQSVRTVAVDPDDPRVVLATVSFTDGSGLIMRSSDGGETFVQVLAEALFSLSFDPAHSGRLYAQAYSARFYRSDDAGAHWASLPNVPYGGLMIRPDGTLLIFDWDPIPDNDVFRSLDGGVTWESVPDLRPPDVFFSSIVVLDDGTFLISGVRGVWRSRTDDEGWLFSSTGIRAQTIGALAVAADADSTLWVSPGAGLFMSKDAGASFQSRPSNLGPFFFIDRLAVHPRRPRVAYALGSGVLKTEDGGRSWQPLNPPLDYERTVIAVDPVNPEYVYTGSVYNHHGAYACTAVRSTDGGETWRCMQPVAIVDFTDLAIDPQDRRVLYGVFGSTLYRSANRGRTWDPVPSPGLDGVVNRVVLDPTRQNRLYVFTDDGFFRSDDRGRTWTRAAAGLPATAMVHDLLVDPSRPSRLWVSVEVLERGGLVRQGLVFRSDDAGRHWKRVSAGLPPEAVEIHLAADPRGADILYAGTDGQGLYRLVVEE